MLRQEEVRNLKILEIVVLIKHYDPEQGQIAWSRAYRPCSGPLRQLGCPLLGNLCINWAAQEGASFRLRKQTRDRGQIRDLN